MATWKQRWWAALSAEGKREKQNKENERAAKLRRYIDAIKVSTGCVDCGYAGHPAALDFDHVRGEKKRSVCHSKSKAQADVEIAKCDVRCANCHRIRTWERRWKAKVYP